MLTQRMLLAIALLAGIAWGTALAQNPTAPSAEENPGMEAARHTAAVLGQEKSEATLVSVYVLGTVEVIAQGKVSIDVKSARETNGAGLKDLMGKSLKVTGKCLRQLEQMGHKKVELRGEVKDGKEFEVFSFTERRAPSAAESPKVQGARGPVGDPIGAINVQGPTGLPSASGNRVPIGALNDPQGAGLNKPNRGTIGTLQGRRKPAEPEVAPDTGQAIMSAAGALR